MVQYNKKKFSDRKKINEFPGKYKFTEFKLISSGGEEVNLYDYFFSLTIFEDIFSSTISGQVDIVDTENLIKNLPILGEESLKIKVTDFVEEEEYTFKIYKISNRKNINYNTLNYTLHFCSEEFYTDHYLTWSKAYDVIKFEEAITEILNNGFESKKNFIYETTDRQRCFILPLLWSPLKSINWMASEAFNEKYSGGNYLFFENVDGFNFLPLENLLNSEENTPYGEINFEPYRELQQDRISFDSRVAKDTMTFETFDVIKGFDTLENMRSGMYNNSVKIIDIINREVIESNYNYFDEFKDHKHLKGFAGSSSYPLNSEKFEENEGDSPFKHIQVAVKHKNLFTNEIEGGNQIEEWYSPKRSQLQQLENFKILGTLPGHIGMKCGMIVNFALHSSENVSTKGRIERDEVYSGQYLITAIKKRFTRERFTLDVEIVKDSRGETSEQLVNRSIFSLSSIKF